MIRRPPAGHVEAVVPVEAAVALVDVAGDTVEEIGRRRPAGRAAALLCLVVGASPALGARPPQAPAETAAAPTFVEVLAHQGLAYPAPSFGCAVHDGDRDGLPDVFLGSHGGQPRVLWGRGEGRFQPEQPGPTRSEPYDGHGAAWADLGGGGGRALLHLVGAEGGMGKGPNRLLVWPEDRARDRAGEVGLALGTARGRTPLWLDWDQDGDLDVVVVNDERKDAPTVVMLQGEDGRFTRAAGGPQLVAPLEFALLADWTGDGVLDVGFVGPDLAAAVYDLGVVPPRPASPALPELHNVVDVVPGDFDGDLRTDLYVVRRPWGETAVARVDPQTVRTHWRCREQPISVRLKAPGPLSVAVLPWSGPWTVQAGRESLAPAPDGRFHLDPSAAAQPSSPSGDPARVLQAGWDPASRTWTLQTTCAEPVEVMLDLRVETGTISEPVLHGAEVTEGLSPGPYRDRLLRGTRDGFALDERSPTPEGSQCVSAAAADFDNDMDLDIFLVCSGTVQNLPDRLLRNRGDGTFDEVPLAGGAAGPSQGLGDAVCAGDLDVDGHVDLVVTNGRPHVDGPDQVFLNQGAGNHWLQLDLVGTRSNAEGLGARVVVRAGRQSQLREQGGGMHRRAQDLPRLHFGLGPHDKASRVEITWPDGTLQVLKDVPADQVLRVVQPPPQRLTEVGG